MIYNYFSKLMWFLRENFSELEILEEGPDVKLAIITFKRYNIEYYVSMYLELEFITTFSMAGPVYVVRSN